MKAARLTNQLKAAVLKHVPFLFIIYIFIFSVPVCVGRVLLLLFIYFAFISEVGAN